MLPWIERLHGVGAQVIMELVHMHDGLVRFPAVARIVESRPSDVELQGGSSIAVAAVSKDRANHGIVYRSNVSDIRCFGSIEAKKA